MTNITWGSLEPLDFLDLSISDTLDLTITTRSSNYIAGDYRLTGEPSNRNEFFGSGFTFDAAGNPVDGTINSLVLTNGGQLIGRLDGFSVGVGQFINWAISGNDRAAQETILAGDDVISGSPFSDFVQGYGGRDVIILGAGDDIAFGGPGNDIFDGSVGIDTLILGAGLANYQLVVWAGIMGAIPRDGATLAADGIDKGVSVERLAFLTTGESVDTPAENFSPLDYIASYADLSAAFGVNAAAGFDHYLFSGAYEGRVVSFSGLECIASYDDLRAVFGAANDAGAAHYIVAGRAEGRMVSFDGLQYIASYEDLIRAIGANSDAGAAHFIQAGAAEHRAPDTFDAATYLANYADLRAAFGTDTEAATRHFITNGFFEGRTDTPGGEAAAALDFLM